MFKNHFLCSLSHPAPNKNLQEHGADKLVWTFNGLETEQTPSSVLCLEMQVGKKCSLWSLGENSRFQIICNYPRCHDLTQVFTLFKAKGRYLHPRWTNRCSQGRDSAFNGFNYNIWFERVFHWKDLIFDSFWRYPQHWGHTFVFKERRELIASKT